MEELQNTTNKVEILDLATIRLAKLERLRRWEMNPSKYFTPNWKGEEFIKAVASGKYLISLLSAGNGIGKSCLSVNMICNLLFPSWNKFFSAELAPLWSKWEYLKRWRIVSDATNIKNNIVPELHKWLPKGKYHALKRGKPYDSYFICTNGWEFDLMTFDQEPKEFESVNLGWIWLDEPPPIDIYKACVSRLRAGGIMWITATPLTWSAWIYDQIVNNVDNESWFRYWTEADVWSACKCCGVRWHLEHHMIEKMIAQYDDNDMQARVLWKFQHLTGLVFKQFNIKVHVIKPFNVNKKDYTVYQAYDPHPRHADAVLWLAVDKIGNKFVIDELKCEWETSEIVHRIKDKDAQYNVVSRIADPWIFNESKHEQHNVATKLSEYWLNYQPAPKTRNLSDKRIWTALHYHKVGDNIIKPPELYVFDTCKNMVYEFWHYRWDDWSWKNKDKHWLKEKPLDKDDHYIECLWRILINEPRFIPYQTENINNNISFWAKELDPYS